MWLKQWFRPPRHLLALFLAITLTLATALGWLSWNLLQRDRALESQRIQERLEYAAGLIAAALQRELSEGEQRLAALVALPDSQLAEEAARQAEGLTENSLLAAFRPQGISGYPPTRLLFYLALPTANEPPSSLFADGEAAEFKQKDYAGAIAIFRKQARSQDAAIRAGALLRLGRNLRKAGQPLAALGAYEDLGQLGSAPVGGMPAELLARHARCVLLDEVNRHDELQREASALCADLLNGRWRLMRGAYRFYAQETRRWFIPNSNFQAREQDAVALAAAVEVLWEEWQRIRRGEGPSAGRRSLWVNERSVLLLWRSTPERLVAQAAGPHYLESQWRVALQPLVDRQRVRLTLTDADGHPVLGQLVGNASPQVVRIAADTQLPWTLHVSSADPGADLAQLADRRRLQLAGLALMAMLLLVGGYFITRAVTRELEVARLQSDFVSAVSHEFRTPLASLRQLSELLADGRVSSDDRRRQYYEALRRESERLHRLVEGLLDFGRMEAGAREYRFETIDPVALVQNVGREFAQEVAERGYVLEFDLDGSLPAIRADREALSRTLWNLLDNAVKYSPACKTVWIEATQLDNRLAIRVRDQGLGISADEQPHIFKKFVRAASADVAGVKGTGLGLAMVQHIVAAHGGEIRVESQPDVGSTFTIVLPTTL